MKIKIKKKLLRESREYIDDTETHSDLSVYEVHDLEHCDFEENRKIIATQIDRNILTPAMQMSDSESEDAEEINYLTRTRDVVKQGRKIPYLYYAYKGVSEEGDLLGQQNIDAVLEMQLEKAKLFKKNLIQKGGGASELLFLCDFGMIASHQMSWDRAYEKKIKSQIPAKSYQRIGTQKGYDRGEFQAGRGTIPLPMSTIAIGKATKPLYAQNVDFMYKSSPEPNLKINPNDLWAFSLYMPLSIAYFMIIHNTDSLTLNNASKLTKQAFQNWATNEEKYRRQYAKAMEEEIEPVSNDSDVLNIYRSLKSITSDFTIIPQLSFKEFNLNYVENKTTLQDYKSTKFQSSNQILPPRMPIFTVLSAPDGIGIQGMEAIEHILKNPKLRDELVKIVEKSIEQMNKSSNAKELAKKQIMNLQTFLAHNFEKVSEQDKEWIQNTLQQYYIKGGEPDILGDQ